VVEVIGANHAVCDAPGWPNAFDDEGRMVRRYDLRPGLLNSPHGLTVDHDGALLVSEWLIGGRFTKSLAATP